MADADRDQSPESPEQQAPGSSKGKQGSGLLLWVGAFFLSFAVINVALFFLMKDRLQEVIQEKATLQAEAAPDSLAVFTPEDSLKTRIAELVEEVQVQSRELVQLEDSTRQLQETLSLARRQLDTLQQREVELSLAEINRLSRVFESMQPAKAAPILMRMDNTSIAAILLNVEERIAAKMMAAMSPERAASISNLIRQRAKEKAREQAGGTP